MNLEGQTNNKHKKVEESTPPNFLKDFSKENPSYRDRIAESIKTERKTFFENKSNAEKYVEKITKKIEDTKKEIEKITLEIKDLKQKLSNTPWYKFNTKREIEYTIEDLENGTLEGDLDDGLSWNKSKLERLIERKNKLVSELNTPYDLPQSLLKKINDFYDSEKIRWKNQEFSAEDIKKYFSDEVLEKLTMEEYLLLWERFPNAVQTHSIRQGIRDHVGKDNMGFEWHNIGKEKYFNNFKEILQDGHIKDTITFFLGDPITKESVEKFINEDNHNFTSKDARVEYLKKLLERYNLGDFRNRSAVHFGTNIVLDKFYGSESENEMFIAFPSAYIASQYIFTGDLGFGIEDMSKNDSWVWSNNPSGIPINSGIVFIPKDAQVDRYNGSKYLLDDNLNPILDNGELQLAKNTVSSKEYWENYFQKNPESKPIRIFYYEGKTGTEGLNNLGKKFNFEKFSSNSNNKLRKINPEEKYHFNWIDFKEMFPENEGNFNEMMDKDLNDENTDYNGQRRKQLKIILKELDIL